MSLEPTSAVTGRSARRGAFALPFHLFFVVALLLSTFGGAFGALTPGASAAATTFTVNSTADLNDTTPGDNSCAAAGGVCTLRAAIQEVNALALLTPADTYVINLASDATYTLSLSGTNEDNAATGDLDIKATLTINGKGAGTGAGAIVVGNDPTNELNPSQQDRVFQVFGGYTVVMNNLTITDGYAFQSNGGGILHDGADVTNGSLTLNGVTVTGNDTGMINNQDNPGAGIYNGAGLTLTLNNSTVSNNGLATRSNPGDGGGIYNAGAATLTGSTVTGNYAGSGGGIYNTGTVTLTGTTVNTNSANNTYNGSTYVGGNGGGIYNTGTATLTGSTVSNNTLTRVNDNNNSSDVNGGGIYNTGTVTLTGSTISTNTANDNNPGNGHANGGGVYNEGVLTLTNNSVINSNSAGLGGGIYNLGELTLTGGTVSNNTSFSTDGGGPFGIFGGGGGIFNGGSTAIADSKISGNSAIIGGGIANSAVNAPQRSGAAAQLVPGTLVLTNTAVTANTALFFGGGIFNSQGNLSITGGALSNNTASGFPFLGFGGQGGALLNLDTATLMNTTISNNSASNFGGNSVVMSGPFSNGNGGGIGNAGVLNVSGTTFSGNSVAGSGSGGALFNGPNFFRGMAGKAGLKPGARAASVDTVATLSNSTLSGNVTTNRVAS